MNTMNLRLTEQLAYKYMVASQHCVASQARYFKNAMPESRGELLDRMEANTEVIENAYHLWQSIQRKEERKSR